MATQATINAPIQIAMAGRCSRYIIGMAVGIGQRVITTANTKEKKALSFLQVVKPIMME